MRNSQPEVKTLPTLTATVTVGFLMCVMVAASVYYGNRLSGRHTPLVDAAMEIKLESTLAHLWFEEILGGDKHVEIDAVWTHLDRSDEYARAMLDGSRSSAGNILPLDHPELRREIEVVREKIADFRQATGNRLEQRTTSTAGTIGDQEYDAIFDDFLNRASQVEHRLHQIIASELRRFNMVQLSLLFLILLATLLATFLVRRYQSAWRRYASDIEKAQLQTRESENRYRELFENMSDGVAVYQAVDDGDDFLFRDHNRAGEDIVGLRREACVGRRLRELFPGVKEMGLLDVLRRVWQTGMPERLPFTRYLDQTLELWVENYVFRLPNHEIVAVYNDVTDRKRAEEKLQQAHLELEQRVIERTAELASANERLKELDRLKTLFIASVSHELRTPLNSVIGFTGLLLTEKVGALSNKQRDYLERVYSSGKHLLNLITDVIDVSKIEAGQIDVYPESFMLKDLVAEAVSNVRAQADSKGLTLKMTIPDIGLYTDRQRLLQCLLNYLSNGIKYSAGGEVHVEAEQENDTVILSVRDQGIGIADEDTGRLFKQFSRIDSVLTRSTLGTGLGLYLTSKLATEVLGGHVGVDSIPNEGSTFWLRFPISVNRPWERK